MTKKLSDEVVLQIKNKSIAGTGDTAIANELGVKRSVVYGITKGKTYKSVGPDMGALDTAKKMVGQVALDQVKPMDPTDQRVLDLEAIVENQRQQILQKNRVVKANSRAHGIVQSVVKELEDRIVPVKKLPSARPTVRKDDRTEETLVMHLSDGHHDSFILPEMVGGLENHNFQVSCRRAENYVDTTIDFTQGHLEKYNFKRLVILANGDHTNGEIHDAVKHSHFKNIFQNCLAISKLHALMIRDLAPYFESVNLVYTSGNHGRRTPRKEQHGPQNNFDYLIAKTTELICADLDNVHFNIPNSFSAIIDIEGHGFHVSHGDSVRSNGGIPFYGLTRQNAKLMCLQSLPQNQNIPVRYQVIGHHHIAGSLSDMNGSLLLNGAWVGTDPYSYNEFSGYREPSQLIHGVHKRHGVTWKMDVKLRSKDELKGPKRYKVEI